MFEVQNRSLSTIPFVHNILFYYYEEKTVFSLRKQPTGADFKLLKGTVYVQMIQELAAIRVITHFLSPESARKIH